MRTERVDPRRLRGLHVLVDDAPHWKRDPVEQAEAACAGGAAVIQLRAKHATDREIMDWAVCIRRFARSSGALFLVNDRFDLALAAEADGVHLGWEDLAPGRIPAALRARLVIGRSTHTPEQAHAARQEPIDYAACGPVFGTRSKASAHSPRGLARLNEAVGIVAPLPLIAIGGIDVDNLASVLETGVAGVAVISAVAAAADARAATRALVDAIARTSGA